VTPLDNSTWITAVSSDQGRQDEIDELVRRGGECTRARLLVHSRIWPKTRCSQNWKPVART